VVRWLIVFDNVEDPTVLEPFWPCGSHGAIILTSRNGDVSRYFSGTSKSVEVSPFSPIVGCEFLASLVTESDGTTLSEEDYNAVQTITDALGNLPLAINLIGGQISSSRMSPKQFLIANPHFERWYIFGGNQNTWNSQAFRRSIDTISTFDIVPQRGQPNMDSSTRLLIEMMAFLDADNIPLTLFHQKKSEDMFVNPNTSDCDYLFSIADPGRLREGPDLPEEMSQLDTILQNPFLDVMQ